ncbi:hypothetical protein RD792_009572 [Penstemon davidsonii]|uniref:Uncharacterized protein n=1 Tax=Penstemon davidsonii TaxID=160366 RepID=A0ABR0CZM6_9LAMI|nr:hypothetical protein RD792_009572 [Penstemon davidsonii]
MAGGDAPSSFPKDVRPPIVTFSPSLWGDSFASFTLDQQVQEKYAEAIQVLKEETRRLILAKENTTPQTLMLIDTLERLGVAYHFEQEIHEKIQQIFKFNLNSIGDSTGYDLFTTALQFRLLRQHRHYVPCGVFDKFKNEKNEFNENISSDAKGLLSLYEAAHVRIHEENILEEAVAFTTHHLNRLLPQLSSPLQDLVKRALHQSLHRGVPRIETRNYISIYEKLESKDEMLLKFAKLDFNFLQNMYRKELCDLTGWWNKFDLKSKLPYARDRLVECYLWGQALHFEPKYSYVRSAVAKVMQMISIMDDTYDNYATLEEADILTEAFERWDINEAERLSDTMKVVYKFVLSIYEDYESDAVQQQKSYAVPYAKETVKQVARAYNKELKWFMGREMPTFEEYFVNTVFTSAIYVMFAAVIPGMTSASEETINWLLSEPNIIIGTAKMGRYVEDLGSHERENRGGEMLTAVDCYMKHHVVPKEDMIEQLINYARVAEVTYKNCADGYTYPEFFLGPQIAAQFLHPIII